MRSGMLTLVCALTILLLFAGPARAQAVGTGFPEGLAVPEDAALGKPVIGFGAAGGVDRVPVILVHGNNDTPYPTRCNSGYGKMQALAAFLRERGYAASELWGLGWQGDQCDLQLNPPARAGATHTVGANVEDLRAFVGAVRSYTGAPRVDVVAHSLGVPLVREWMRRDLAHRVVRRFVGIDGTNHGIINCSPSPANYFALPVTGGFTPDSPLCLEVGSVRTPLMAALNGGDESPGPTEYTMIVNADRSFVYISAQDGPFPAVPEQDREGRPQSFAKSAWLEGARVVELREQDAYGEPLVGTAHTGILASPEAWEATLAALGAPEPAEDPGAALGRERVTLRTTARRTSRSRLVVRGALALPASLDPSACADGVVRLVLAVAGRARRVTRRVELDDECRFAATLARATPGRRLTLSAAFLGTELLRPASARRLTVR